MRTTALTAAAVFVCLGIFMAPTARAGAAAALAVAPAATPNNGILVEVRRRGRAGRGGYRGRRGFHGRRSYRGRSYPGRRFYGRRHARPFPRRAYPRRYYHRRWHRVRPYYGYSLYLPPLVGYRHVRRGPCAWLYRKWRHTGSHYWRRRYWRCMDRHYW